MPSEHGANCFFYVCTSATERVESDEALVGEFKQLVVNSLYLTDQRAITIVIMFRSGKTGILWGERFLCLLLAFIAILWFSYRTAQLQVKLLIVNYIISSN